MQSPRFTPRMAQDALQRPRAPKKVARLAMDPLTDKGEKIKGAMQEQYGKEKGERVFYASKNKGTIKGVDRKLGKDYGTSEGARKAAQTRKGSNPARPLIASSAPRKPKKGIRTLYGSTGPRALSKSK